MEGMMDGLMDGNVAETEEGLETYASEDREGGEGEGLKE